MSELIQLKNSYGTARTATRETVYDSPGNFCRSVDYELPPGVTECEACHVFGSTAERFRSTVDNRCEHCDGVGFFGLDPHYHDAPPGSQLKIGILRLRTIQGWCCPQHSLFHPDDKTARRAGSLLFYEVPELDQDEVEDDEYDLDDEE